MTQRERGKDTSPTTSEEEEHDMALYDTDRRLATKSVPSIDHDFTQEDLGGDDEEFQGPTAEKCASSGVDQDVDGEDEDGSEWHKAGPLSNAVKEKALKIQEDYLLSFLFQRTSLSVLFTASLVVFRSSIVLYRHGMLSRHIRPCTVCVPKKVRILVVCHFVSLTGSLVSEKEYKSSVCQLYKSHTAKLEVISLQSLAEEFAAELEWFNNGIKEAVDLAKAKDKESSLWLSE